jgi:hypothetical protein
MIQKLVYYKSNKFLILVVLFEDKIIGRLNKLLLHLTTVLYNLLFFLLFGLSVDQEDNSLCSVLQNGFIAILDKGNVVLLAV